MRLKLSGENKEKRFSGEKGTFKKMLSLVAALGLSASILSGCNINGKTPIERAEYYKPHQIAVFTDLDGSYKMCPIKKYNEDENAIEEVLTGEKLLDEDGNECVYYGLYSKPEEEWRKGEDAGKTYLPYEAGIPLSEVLPEENFADDEKLDSGDLEDIYEKLPEYMHEYLSSRELPLYRLSDELWWYQNNTGNYGHIDADLLLYSKLDENHEDKTPETIVGYGVWRRISSSRNATTIKDFYIDYDYFYDISDNSLKSVYDENGEEQYLCLGRIDSFRFMPEYSQFSGKNFTTEEIDKIRKNYYQFNKGYWDSLGYSDYEFEYIFPENNPEFEITIEDMEEVASQPSSIDSIDTVREGLNETKTTEDLEME